MTPSLDIRKQLANPAPESRRLWLDRLDRALGAYGRALNERNRPRAAALYAQLHTPAEAAALLAGERGMR